jgi:hypothetical protein
MMRKLEPLFKEREIPFDAKNNRINCFPHIINIVAQHVIKKISTSVAADADDAFIFERRNNVDLNRVPPASFDEACASDPLSRVRKIIVAIRASGQRRDDFNTWIRLGMSCNFACSKLSKSPQETQRVGSRTALDRLSLYPRNNYFVMLELAGIAHTKC